jgi:hypothetical protein
LHHLVGESKIWADSYGCRIVYAMFGILMKYNASSFYQKSCRDVQG